MDVERCLDLEQLGLFFVADLLALQVLNSHKRLVRCRAHGHEPPHCGQQIGHFLREPDQVVAGEIGLDEVGHGAGLPADPLDLQAAVNGERAHRDQAGLE